jgi:hypothetical protein
MCRDAHRGACRNIQSLRSSLLHPTALRTLDRRAREAVRGGISRSIVSPRDPQSGLPTDQVTAYLTARAMR